MESNIVRNGCRRAIVACHNASRRRTIHQTSKCLATPIERQGDVKAAPPIRFNNDRNQFGRGRPRAQLVENDDSRNDPESQQRNLLRRIRIVPASPSYFTATPKYTDDLLELTALLRKYQTLPTLPRGEAPSVRWKSRDQYKVETQENVRSKSYNMMIELLKRLNYIHPSLIPAEVTEALDRYKRLVQPHLNRPKPIVIDESGRAKAVGRRKSSKAAVYLVEGDGQCLINGKKLTDFFGRMHDRESAVWALKATQRLDKYNVWALVKGGGTTGQAEAITLGVAKALLAHEPALKPALRRAGVVSRDPRRVERKKPGKLKARKMPAWVKR
ncbi:hypothetical protein DOTSEDRAFT_145391 [Dothistroma septosporum NZE10]|uniref:Small ribosomal subunit protein uS9m n=1 Tax=Dothistroma septosporum (strain NZE10 / CBS 128990) TaxID=675120 RepID=N1PUB4_DOTSN|nr:hypothetical protein DOTSEDRAFT_145391 [Dothistroma septosporum NZE10]